jgi:hypothetical protein
MGSVLHRSNDSRGAVTLPVSIGSSKWRSQASIVMTSTRGPSLIPNESVNTNIRITGLKSGWSIFWTVKSSRRDAYHQGPGRFHHEKTSLTSVSLREFVPSLLKASWIFDSTEGWRVDISLPSKQVIKIVCLVACFIACFA